jgi:predicted DCC family thiol-disulfide oxidoreductase YuxK
VLWLTVAPDGSEQVLVRSEAVLAVLRHVGGVWAGLAVLGRWVPRPLRDAVYAAVAARRHWLAPRTCQLPAGRERR